VTPIEIHHTHRRHFLARFFGRRDLHAKAIAALVAACVDALDACDRDALCYAVVVATHRDPQRRPCHAIAVAFALAACSANAPAQGERTRPDDPARGAKLEGSGHDRDDGEIDTRAAIDHPPSETDVEVDPLIIEVDPSTGESIAYDSRALLDAGNDALQGGDALRAIAYYERLAEEFSQSELVTAALYNRGLALERLGEHDAAIDQYRDLAAAVQKGRDAIDALIRAGAVLADLRRWPASVDVFEELLARDDLSPSDRVEGYARLGYALYENKDDPRAEEVLGEALAVAGRLGEGEHLETSYFVAMSAFYLGLIPRRQFSDIPLRLPDEQMARDLEAKAELVLLTHERLTRAIAVGEPHWATAAGYELGAIQEEFWRAIVSAPIPPHLGPEAVQAYTSEVHDQAREFLERSLTLYSRTVELAEVFRTTTRWSRAAEERAGVVADLLARERAGELVAPETETASDRADVALHHDWDVTSYVPGRTDL
jgi:tetratricopeptide (TPR) repeat protein